MNVWYFLVRLGRGGNLSADLSRVVTEGSRGLGRRVKRQDEGSRIDFKNLHAFTHSWSWYSIKRPWSDARLSWPGWWLHHKIVYMWITVTYLRYSWAVSWLGIEPTSESPVSQPLPDRAKVKHWSARSNHHHHHYYDHLFWYTVNMCETACVCCVAYSAEGRRSKASTEERAGGNVSREQAETCQWWGWRWTPAAVSIWCWWGLIDGILSVVSVFFAVSSQKIMAAYHRLRGSAVERWGTVNFPCPALDL